MNDRKIISLINQGTRSSHEKALQMLYEKWAVQMKAFFLSQGAAERDLEDIFQETVVKIWRGADKFAEQGEARSWMWAIARNTLKDYQRKHFGMPEHIPINGEEDDPDPPARVAPVGDPSDCVDLGLDSFAKQDPERAYALQLWVADIDVKEIADRLGRTYGATRQYLTECRKKLKPFVEPCLEYLGEDL
jgi:RNA polymerase sigma factor (sigma-70 family)